MLLSAGLFLPERALRPFRSVRFNIWLFAVIAAASILGTFAPALNVYHSWWFSGLLALMAFDVVACKLRRGPPPVDRLFSRSRFRISLQTTMPPAEAAAEVRGWFREIRVSFHEGPGGFFGARHRLQRWGDLVLHVSIVVLLAGGLMGAVFGFDEILPIPVGETMRLKNRPLEVTLEDFDMQYYAASGEVSRYASRISLRENGVALAQKRIVVNDPLDWKRIRFYQASWGMTPTFRSAILRIGGQDIAVKPGEAVPLGPSGLSIRANRLAPTFKIDADGRPTVADHLGRNPALQIDFLEGGAVRARVWVLYNSAEAYRMEGERAVPAPPPPFTWVAFDPVLYSGIQVGYDPGAPLFWWGAMALMVGLCSHFYLHQKRVRVQVLPGPEGAEVIVGGWNSRTAEEFEFEFEDWVARLRARVT